MDIKCVDLLSENSTALKRYDDYKTDLLKACPPYLLSLLYLLLHLHQLFREIGGIVEGGDESWDSFLLVLAQFFGLADMFC